METPCKIYYCYKATNKINGKVYIGFAADPQTRWRNHKLDAATGRGYVFHTAIRKHGWDAFEFEVVCCGKDKMAMLEFVEPSLIEQYHSSIGQNGYNMHQKVMGASSRVTDVRKKRGPLSDEHKAKLSAALKGHGGYTEESRYKMSESAKRQPKRYGKDNHFFGKHLSSTAKQKLSNARLGKSLSQETRNKMSDARSIWWVVTYPDGRITEIKNLAAFCRELSLNKGHLRRGKYKGYCAVKRGLCVS